MAPSILLMLIAGTALVIIFLVVLILWSIQNRREENGFQPTPADARPIPYAIAPTLSSSPGAQRTPEIKNFLTGLLRDAAPNLSAMMDLDKKVKEYQSTVESPKTNEERLVMYQWALDKMLEKNPENALLQQLRANLKLAGNAADQSVRSADVQVFQAEGKTVLRVNGKEHSFPQEVLDPAASDQVRRMVEALTRKTSS